MRASCQVAPPMAVRRLDQYTSFLEGLFLSIIIDTNLESQHYTLIPISKEISWKFEIEGSHTGAY